MESLYSYLKKNYAPRWVIIQIDLSIVVISTVLAFLLRFNFDLAHPDIYGSVPLTLAIFFTVRFAGFYLFKTYHGVVRYTSTEDAKRIFLSLTAGSIFIILYNLISYARGATYFIPFSIIIFEYLCTALLMTSFRVFIKILYSELKSAHVDKMNILIFGAGESGLITKRTIDQDKDSKRRIIGFLDDDVQKKGKSLEGVKIYNINDGFEDIVEKYKISEVIIAIQELKRERKEQLVDLFLKHKIEIKTVPPASNWINGEFNVNQISNIKIEDLLEREPIRLDQDRIFSQINDKRVLVTGACGSIGSELVRQIIRFFPAEIILVDQAETPLYELELELREKSSYVNFKTIISDICNKNKLESIFKNYRPDIIYHAAAYKHVPLMEVNPTEAVLTNVNGTKNLADLATKYGVKEFVFISTDKAVNPTNVMGASKRVAEIYVQSLNANIQHNKENRTKFITTRFGNVLGSNGSVIPRFRKQIAGGGPVTVTHPEISRYFMTIPESCQLILEAGMMGKGGEIYIFDMGEPVKIIDLAHKMIILSGLRPGKDIQVTFTGLRPGEKIKEELLNNKEKTLPTHHEKIMVGKVREYPFEVVEKEIDELLSLVQSQDETAVVSKMKAIVPEFISNNSIFEDLDHMNIQPTVNAGVNA